MKRSEMVTFIQNWVTHPVTLSPIWTREEASEFLKALEDVGMRPPPRYLHLAWEPENED